MRPPCSGIRKNSDAPRDDCLRARRAKEVTARGLRILANAATTHLIANVPCVRNLANAAPLPVSATNEPRTTVLPEIIA